LLVCLPCPCMTGVWFVRTTSSPRNHSSTKKQLSINRTHSIAPPSSNRGLPDTQNLKRQQNSSSFCTQMRGRPPCVLCQTCHCHTGNGGPPLRRLCSLQNIALPQSLRGRPLMHEQAIG